MFVIGNVIGSIFWGAVLAVLVVLLTYIVCRAIRNQSVQGLPAIIVLGALLLLTGAQTTMIVGALYGKGYVDDISSFANSIVSTGSEAVDFEELRHNLSDEYPIAKPILDKIDGSGAANYVRKGHTMVDFVADNLNDTLNYYILRRILWLIGFVVVAVVAILLLAGNKKQNKFYGMQDLDEISSVPMEFDNYEL